MTDAAVTPTLEDAEVLLAGFRRMVAREGGALSVVDLALGCVTVGYAPGTAATCETDACVLPEVDLQTLMNEVLTAKAAGFEARVVRRQTAT